MGWTYQQRPEGQSIKDFLAEKFAHENGRAEQRLAACAVVALRTAYCAVSRTDKQTGETLTNAVVCHLDYAPNDRFNQGYKEVEEGMGPTQHDCPERILDLLSPVEEIYGPGNGRDWATGWRRRCREKISERKARPSLKTGRFLVFDEPVAFANGEQRRVFYVADAKKRSFTARKGVAHIQRRYRIPRSVFAENTYRVLETEPHEQTPRPTPQAPPQAPPSAAHTQDRLFA